MDFAALFQLSKISCISFRSFATRQLARRSVKSILAVNLPARSLACVETRVFTNRHKKYV